MNIISIPPFLLPKRESPFCYQLDSQTPFGVGIDPSQFILPFFLSQFIIFKNPNLIPFFIFLNHQICGAALAK